MCIHHMGVPVLVCQAVHIHPVAMGFMRKRAVPIDSGKVLYAGALSTRLQPMLKAQRLPGKQRVPQHRQRRPSNRLWPTERMFLSTLSQKSLKSSILVHTFNLANMYRIANKPMAENQRRDYGRCNRGKHTLIEPSKMCYIRPCENDAVVFIGVSQ